jgi:predicted phage tail protein
VDVSQAFYSPHPLMPAHERVFIKDTPLAGETIVEWMERTGLAERIGRQPIRVTINGWRVGREVWKTCRPKPGTTIHIQAEVRGGNGGGSGGKVLRTVAFIVLAYLSYGTSTYLTGAGYGAAAAAAGSAAVMVAGSLAINALFPLPKPQLPSGQSQESPNYALSGGSNGARPYEPMPIIMGTRRVYPDLGARPYTEFRDGEQYLFQVFDFGYNSDISLSDFKIGENAMDNFTGVLLEESGPDGKLNTFPANVDTIAGGNLDPSVYVTRTSSPDSTALAVEIDGVLFRTTDTGDIAPYAVGVDIQYRPVGGTTWTQVHLIDDSTVALMSPTGGVFGFFSLAWVSRLRYNEAAANGVPGDITLVNSNRKPLRRTYRWEVPKGQYEVKVARTTPADPSPTLVAELVFTQLRCYQPDVADYTGRKRVAIMIRASGQLNGAVEQFNCMARAKTIAWTGTAWVKQETSNPAWWALAAARGTYVKPIQRYFDTDLGTKASAPHNPACVITGDLEVIVQWNSTLWHANSFDTVLDKTSTVGQSAFYVAVRSAGGLQVGWSADGAAVTLFANSTVVVPFADDGTMKWLRYRLDVNNGAGGWTATFDWSEDKINWTQLGAPVTGVGVTSIFAGTSPLAVGSSNGKLGYAEIRNGFGGPVVSKFDPSVEALTGATTFVSAAGDTWTMIDRVPPLGGKPYIQEIAGSRRTSGAGLPDSRIDIENLKSFGAWCAAQNLTFNYVFDQPITASDMIDAIALRGRGTKSWGSGKLGVVWDAPALPVVAIFSMANTVAGSFEIEYMTEQLADEVAISFDNPDLGYARDTVRVPPGLASPALSRTIDTVGCTSKTEAAQDGNLYLASNAYRARRYRWQMDFEGMPLSRGEVGTLAQDLAALDYTGGLPRTPPPPCCSSIARLCCRSRAPSSRSSIPTALRSRSRSCRARA